MVDNAEQEYEEEEDFSDDLEDDSPDDTPEHEDEPGGSEDEDVRARKLTREKNRALKLLEEREAELERYKNQPVQPVYQPPAQEQTAPSYSDTEVNDMYSRGELSVSDANLLIEQNKIKHETDLENRIVQRVNQVSQNQKLISDTQGKITQFIKEIPGLTDKSSDENAEVKKKYNELRAMGSPDNAITELLAIETTFGSLDRLRGTRSKDIDEYDRSHREVSGETGSSARPSDGGSSNVSLKGIPKSQVEFWRSQGQDPKEMAKWWTPGQRAR